METAALMLNIKEEKEDYDDYIEENSFKEKKTNLDLFGLELPITIKTEEVNNNEENTFRIGLEEEMLHEKIDIKEECLEEKTGEEKPYKCNKRSKRFFSESKLNCNKKIHLAKRSFQCELCKKKFTYKHYFVAHVKTCDGKKPFQCKLCLKRFAHQRNVRVHLRNHTDAKPYECNICPSRFRLLCLLKQHLHRHPKEKLFECPVCDFKCNRQYIILNHMKTVCKISKPFKCDICPATYASKSGLIKHVRIHTPIAITLSIDCQTN